ncbi:MAG TPA: nitroreductase family protein [Methylovirgula sp.]|nr:nitroreductase family protein [Methylovirgula sp.]
MSEVNPRVADYPIDRQFLERWSPRAFTGEPVPENELRTMFEAARWAPSSSNLQPWRFLYARQGTPHFEKFLALLVDGNKVWAKNAGALVVLISKTTQPVSGTDKVAPSRTHSFDTGTAWGYLALEAMRLGWAAHAMAGFHVERTIVDLGIPEDYRPEAAIAIGRRDDKSILPEYLQAREEPNSRRPQRDFVSEGGFPPPDRRPEQF